MSNCSCRICNLVIECIAPITHVTCSEGCVISLISVKFLQKRRTKDPESASISVLRKSQIKDYKSVVLKYISQMWRRSETELICNWTQTKTNTKSYNLIKCLLFQKLFSLVIDKWFNITAIHPKTIYTSKFWVQTVHWLDAKVRTRALYSFRKLLVCKNDFSFML